MMGSTEKLSYLISPVTFVGATGDNDLLVQVSSSETEHRPGKNYSVLNNNIERFIKYRGHKLAVILSLQDDDNDGICSGDADKFK